MRLLLLAVLFSIAAVAADEGQFRTWREYLGGADSSQYSSLTEINKSNVKQLAVAWTYSTGDSKEYLFNPLVVPTIITLVPKGDPGADTRAAAPPHPAPIPLAGPFIHYTAPYTSFISKSTRLPSITPPWFRMTAYDLNNGTIEWQVPYGSVPALAAQGHADTGVLQQQRGGPVVTAGGLIFAATNDKKFRAYDEDTGKVIWETNLPAAAEGVPAVYEIGGREFLVICAAAGNGPAVTLVGSNPAAAASAPQGAYIAFALPKH